MFNDDCKTWKRQTTAYKTWAQFKIDLSVAYKEHRDSLDISPQAAGFHAVTDEYQQESTIDAIANLATATGEDRKAVSNLTDTNATLTKSLARTTEKLIASMAQVTNLTKQLADN
jgi:septal ring factor EnvC (AmiA/AmiB activator)